MGHNYAAQNQFFSGNFFYQNIVKFWLSYQWFSVLCDILLPKPAIWSCETVGKGFLQYWKLTLELLSEHLLKVLDVIVYVQYVVLLHVCTPIFYWWFWCRISCRLRIIKKLGTENQQKLIYWPLKFFKILKNHCSIKRLVPSGIERS